MNSCISDSVASRENSTFVASKHLGDVPQLSLQEEKSLYELIKHVRDNDEDDSDTENQNDGSESSLHELEEEDDDDEVIDDSILFHLLESASNPDGSEESLNILDSCFNETLMSYLSRPPAKRKSILDCKSRDGKKGRYPSSKVNIVSRITPQKSENDEHEYRVITLSNGLRAVLIRKPAPPAETLDDKFQEFFDSLLDAQKTQRRKCQKETLLPPNFPSNFPMVNQRISQLIRNIIQKELNENFDVSKDRGESKITFSPATKNIDSRTEEKFKSTFAVVVNVGTCDDPDDYHGLAHFTEHMVHYGSDKYPGEEEYFAFGFNNSYNFNAFTENHTTTYYASVPLACLDKNMDMLASMLSRPVFGSNMTYREINAVDAEFHLSRHMEILRRRFLFQHALKQGHPLSKFDCGNVKTLLGAGKIHKVLRDFHSKHYVASSMTVGLESILPLATQEKIILDYFSDLPQGSRKIYRETPPKAKEEHVVGKGFNMDYVLQGLCSLSNLWIAWPIPETFTKNHSNKSLSVLLKILGDDKDGGLAHYLANKEYIWLMLCNKLHPYSDPVLTENKYACFVTIDYFLTPKGEDHIDDIMQATFSFIDQLSKVSSDSMFLRTFYELKLQAERNEKLLRGDLSSPILLAKELQRVEPENILKHDSWLWQDAAYNPAEIRTILGIMNSTNMIVIQTLPVNKNVRDYMKTKSVCTAPFSNGDYVVQPIGKRLGFGANCKRCGNKNYNFSVLHTRDESVESLMVLPPTHYGVIRKQVLKSRSSDSGVVLKAVHVGNVLKNYDKVCLVNYINSEVQSSARNFAMSLLWITSVYLSSLYELKNDLSYDQISATVTDLGISIGVISHEDRMLQQIENLNRKFFGTPVSETSLKMSRTALLAVYDLLLGPDADFITEELLHFMTCDHTGDILSDSLEYIKQCSVNDVNNFCDAFKSKTLAFILIGGNVTVEEGKKVVEIVDRHGLPYSSNFSPENRLSMSESSQLLSCYDYNYPIASGERCIRVKSSLCYSYTHTVTNFYYVGNYDARKYMLWWNSLYFFKSRSFINLRMKKQLGYHVHTYFPKPEEDQPMVIGVGVVSTASKFTPCELDQHLDEFMVDYGKYLDTVDEKNFKRLKKQHGVKNTALDIKLADAKAWYQYHFGDIFGRDYPNKFHALGMCKISVQVLGNENKSCKCETCGEISGWRRAESWDHFQFAKGKGSRKDYFIDDPKKLRGQ